MNVRTSIRESAVQEFQAVFGGRLQLDVPLARYTSARVGGPSAAIFNGRFSGRAGNGRYHRLQQTHSVHAAWWRLQHSRLCLWC